MRTISTASDLALTSGDRASWTRVEVNDGASWIDLSDHVGIDWLHSVTYGEQQDGRAASATVIVKNRERLTSLSPLVTGSLANDPNVVLAVTNSVRIDAAVMGQGVAPGAADWIRVFEGKIDEVKIGAVKITLRCTDTSIDLRDAFIEDETEYGDGATGVETVMQSILTAWASGVTLYTPNGTGGTPLNAGDLAGWNIKRYSQKREPVLDALRTLAGTIGYDLRYRWHANTSAFQLQIFEPDRTAAAVDRAFDDSDYFGLGDVSINRKDVRNFVLVTYENADGKRLSVTATDASSILKYGRRWMEISEEQSSQIDTSTEAQTLADAVLADLKEPDALITMDLPFFPWAQLQDLYQVAANNIHFDSPIDLAVIGIQNRIGQKEARTQLQLRGKPNAGTKKWINIQRPWPKTLVDSANQLPTRKLSSGNLCGNGDFSGWPGG